MQRRYLAEHVRLVAGRRDDVVDHGLPDRDDDVHVTATDATGATRRLLDDHGEPGAGVLGFADGEDDRRGSVGDADRHVLGRYHAAHVRWTPGGATTSSITVSPTMTTTYTVTATDATGATQTESVTSR